MWYDKINHLDNYAAWDDASAMTAVLTKIAMMEKRELFRFEDSGSPSDRIDGLWDAAS